MAKPYNPETMAQRDRLLPRVPTRSAQHPGRQPAEAVGETPVITGTSGGPATPAGPEPRVTGSWGCRPPSAS